MSRRVLECVLVVALIVAISGCGITSKLEAKKDTSCQQVSLSTVPEPVRLTIEKLTAGGEIKKIEKEDVDGKVVYDVEAKEGEKDVEYDVGSDGTVLTSEESIPYGSLPTAVRAAAEKYFGSAAGLKASQEVESGKTFYEVEGRKKGKAVALKMTGAGQILEKEQE